MSSQTMKGEPPSRCPSDRGGDGGRRSGDRGSSSLLSEVAVLAGVAVSGVSAAAAAAASSSRSEGGGSGGSRRGGPAAAAASAAAVASEEVVAAKMEEVARVIGEVADGVLKHVSDRMPGLEAFTLEILDTIFAPRLVLRLATDGCTTPAWTSDSDIIVSSLDVACCREMGLIHAERSPF